MPLHEGAAAGVLTGQPHHPAVQADRAECQQLGEGPVDATLASHFRPFFQYRPDPGMRGETCGQVDVCIGDPFDDTDIDPGVQPSRHELLGLHRLAGRRG